MQSANELPHSAVYVSKYSPHQLKDCWAQIHDIFVDENPLGQVKFVQLFKVTMLHLHVIMMRPEMKLITSAARQYWS